MTDFVKVEDKDHIYYLTHGVENPIESYLPGFYFADEASLFHGPFETQEEAEISQSHYCEWLNPEQ